MRQFNIYKSMMNYLTNENLSLNVKEFLHCENILSYTFCHKRNRF